MQPRQLGVLGALCVALAAGLACQDEAARPAEDYRTRLIRLPDGAQIRAEVLTRPDDMARGMMFRDPLPEGEGLLFVHARIGNYKYWMFQVKVPLDILWLDERGRVVEISPSTPPCPGPESRCPSYGGTAPSCFVLELPAGAAARHNLKVGDLLSF